MAVEIKMPALSPTMETGTLATWNVAVGDETLGLCATGTDNVAIGDTALDSLTTGGKNIAIGYAALQSSGTAANNDAQYNIGIGYWALLARLFLIHSCFESSM